MNDASKLTEPDALNLTDSAIDALVRGLYPDPFSALGLHTLNGVSFVRTFQPDADRVELLRPGAAPRQMIKLHSEGLFEIRLDGPLDSRHYRFRITDRHHHTVERHDPYAFGRILSDHDLYLFGEGKLYRAYERFGAHPMTFDEVAGVYFAVWAPNAHRVSVIGDFNGWDGRRHLMRRLWPSGVWELFVPDIGPGERYKFEIRSFDHDALLHKADPFGFRFEEPPKSASVVHHGEPYHWRDAEWMERRKSGDAWLTRPMAIYEVHLPSWAREEGNRFPTYRELAERLIPYVKRSGFTHIELLPVMEHPFLGSWGYQVVGFFAPTSRQGTPDDFKWFIDECHLNDIGVILDWVPGHFPKDVHGLARFDGTALYEHLDPRQGEHQDWGTLIFNYGRNEVRNFLLSNAIFWLDRYHADGLRVDAVASMIYLDYSRPAGQWVPNQFGGRENIDAIHFLRELNTLTHGEYPGTVTVAEESTAWPAVSRPTYVGGLGFTYKWNMGWMHDMLDYMRQDPLFRRWIHNRITFSLLYAFTENFMLPFSHDEVVHGKRSMFEKMPGDEWQRAANLRVLYGYLYTHPGKKLLFMGSEFGQRHEWSHDTGLEWDLAGEPLHAGIYRVVQDLNAMYRREPSFHQVDFDGRGFQWIDCNDHENSVVSFVRRAVDPRDFTVVVLNFTPVPREAYRLGVPEPGAYLEVLNTDASVYGGSNVGNAGLAVTTAVETHGHPQSLLLRLPPLGCLVLKPVHE